MSTPAELQQRFCALGARFLIDADRLAERLLTVRALVFDWDGVFNSGAKGDGSPSTFSESDSMGTNLWRYALWRRHGRLPLTVVVTGAKNSTAESFAKREHFSLVCSNVLDKGKLLSELAERHHLEAAGIACMFDDVNDLAMAAQCGARFMVRRPSSPMLEDFVAGEGLCDYVTAAEAGRFAVREVAELALGLTGDYRAVVESRRDFDDAYAEFFAARQAAETELKLYEHGHRGGR
jgi:3-deoxy-D-manno-octulosonate 8-phosphate phosphatase (KDO 8-P phosphatase)